MPDLPITQLPSASALQPIDVFPVVQSDVTKQTTFNEIYSGLTGSFVSSSTFNSYTSSVQSYYLSAYHTASLTTAALNTQYSMSFSTTDFSNGITIGGPIKNQIQIAHAGIYDIQFSAQVDKTSGTTVSGYIWLAKNNTDLDESCCKVEIKQGGGTDAYQLLTKQWIVSDIAAQDYLQLRFAVSNVSGISLEYTAAQISPYARPAIPSATITITPGSV
jgi:hypothetical protein